MNRALALSTIIASCLVPSVAFGGAVAEFGKAVYSEVERRVIRDYYNEKYGSIDGQREHRDRDWDGDRHRDDRYGKKHQKSKKHKGKHHRGHGNPQGLPPGIAKKLARGGSLPPGIAKKHLPMDLESRLPPVRDGYERMEVDGRVLLIEAATNTIVDIIRRAELLEAGTKADKPERYARTSEPPGETHRDTVGDRPKSDDPRPSDNAWWQFWKD